MPYQKLQSSSALKIIPSDSYDIPNYAPVYTGTPSSVGTYKLIDNTQKFSQNIVGYTVYDLTGTSVSVVLEVQDENTLLLKDDIIGGSDKYAIFPNTHSGCVLYVGNGGSLKVTMSGGSEITFFNVQDGTFLPISVSRVWNTETTATNIVALW